MKKLFSALTKTALLSVLFLAIAPVLLSVLSSDAFAQAGVTVSASANSNMLVTTICNVMQIVTGNAGKAFAAFAIISVGIGFFTGKVSWGLMIGVAAGIAAMFGAPQIVAAISGKNTYDCGQ
jgi:type IV secretory pathway VirB2 component (pilin)